MPARTFKRQIIPNYFAPFVAMGLLAVIVLWCVKAQISSTESLEHSEEVLLLAKDAEIEFRQMRIDVRSYTISRDQRPVAGLRESQRSFDSDLKKLGSLVSGNPHQERRLANIRQSYAQYGFQAEKPGSPPSLRSNEEGAAAEPVLAALQDFLTAEYSVQTQRSAAQKSVDQLIVILIPLLCVLIAVVLGASGWRQIRAASQQFAAALREREAANRLKDEFLDVASHEPRSPLNTIALSSEVLMALHKHDDRTRRVVTAIDRAAKAQARLLDDLVDRSRVDRGQLRLDIQDVDLRALIRAAIDSVRNEAEANSISIETTIDAPIDSVKCDPLRLQQVVWNFLTNAIKFTPAGGRVDVRLKRTDSNVEIVVADSGQGIEPRLLPFIFDRFWQGEGQKSHGRGLGLGLSIVKEIVTLHGGTVEARSEGPGKGATFVAKFPLLTSGRVSAEKAALNSATLPTPINGGAGHGTGSHFPAPQLPTNLECLLTVPRSCDGNGDRSVRSKISSSGPPIRRNTQPLSVQSSPEELEVARLLACQASRDAIAMSVAASASRRRIRETREICHRLAERLARAPFISTDD